MFVEGCHILTSLATNWTPYSHIQMFPDVSQDGIQTVMCKMTAQIIFTSTWSIQMLWNASARIASLGTITTGKDIELLDSVVETDRLIRVVVM